MELKFNILNDLKKFSLMTKAYITIITIFSVTNVEYDKREKCNLNKNKIY